MTDDGSTVQKGEMVMEARGERERSDEVLFVIFSIVV